MEVFRPRRFGRSQHQRGGTEEVLPAPPGRCSQRRLLLLTQEPLWKQRSKTSKRYNWGDCRQPQRFGSGGENCTNRRGDMMVKLWHRGASSGENPLTAYWINYTRKWICDGSWAVPTSLIFMLCDLQGLGSSAWKRLSGRVRHHGSLRNGRRAGGEEGDGNRKNKKMFAKGRPTFRGQPWNSLQLHPPSPLPFHSLPPFLFLLLLLLSTLGDSYFPGYKLQLHLSCTYTVFQVHVVQGLQSLLIVISCRNVVGSQSLFL